MENGGNYTAAGELYPVTLLTEDRQRIVYILLFISAALSILGSSTIVYKICINISKATPYDRIMLGLSACDIVGSLSYGILNPFLAPADTSERIWSIGNDASCTFLGFLNQFALAAVLYNAMLSFYYLLTIKYKVKRKEFAHKYEIYMHVLCLTFGMGTGGIGVVIGLYSEVDIGYGCWVNDYPKGCDEPGGPPCIGHIYGIIYAALPGVFTFLSLAINNCCIYLYVRKNLTVNDATNESTLSKTEEPQPSAIQEDAMNSINTDPTNGDSNVQQNQIISTTIALPIRHSPAYNDRVQEVATQGMLYVGSFVVCFTPAFIFRVKDTFRPDSNFDENDIFALCALMSITYPLQGFLNMLVYNRPNYTRVRRAYPKLYTAAVIRRACLSSDIPRLTEVVVSSHHVRTRSLGQNKRSVVSNSKRKNGVGKNSGGGYSSFCSSLDIIPENSLELRASINASDMEESTTTWNEQECVLEIHDFENAADDNLQPQQGLETQSGP